jgi:predicted Zn-dependent protease
MKVSCPKAYCATLCLLLYLALSATATAADAGEAESVRAAEAFRANLLTPSEEKVVGERLAYLYEQRHGLLKEAGMEARIERVLMRLSAATPTRQLQVKVIRGAEAEAVSFPAGRIYLTSALLKLASTDDELAAVIAHEAAHIEGRHLACLIATALALPFEEQENFPTRLAITTGQTLRFDFPATLDDARLSCEVEADEMAVRWLERAGYEQSALPLLLESITARLSSNARNEREALRTRIALLRGDKKRESRK